MPNYKHSPATDCNFLALIWPFWAMNFNHRRMHLLGMHFVLIMWEKKSADRRRPVWDDRLAAAIDCYTERIAFAPIAFLHFSMFWFLSLPQIAFSVKGVTFKTLQLEETTLVKLTTFTLCWTNILMLRHLGCFWSMMLTSTSSGVLLGRPFSVAAFLSSLCRVFFRTPICWTKASLTSLCLWPEGSVWEVWPIFAPQQRLQ